MYGNLEEKKTWRLYPPDAFKQCEDCKLSQTEYSKTNKRWPSPRAICKASFIHWLYLERIYISLVYHDTTTLRVTQVQGGITKSKNTSVTSTTRSSWNSGLWTGFQSRVAFSKNILSLNKQIKKWPIKCTFVINAIDTCPPLYPLKENINSR